MTGRIREFVARVTKAHPEELPAALAAALTFFCVFTSYAILKPLRDEMGVQGGVNNLPWMFSATLLATLAGNPLLGLAARRWPRARLIPLVYRFFALNMIVFFLLFGAEPKEWTPVVARCFFVWTSVFNLFALSLFWGFMADRFALEQGRRLFAFIGAGGTLGAMAGASITSLLAGAVGPRPLLLVAAGILEIAVWVLAPLRRSAPGDGASAALPLRDLAALAAPSGKERPINPFSGVAHVFGSRYLLTIGVFMLLYTVTSTFLYQGLLGQVALEVKDSATRTALFARIDLTVNACTLVVQSLLTARLIARFGLTAALLAVPAVTALGFGALAATPVLATFVVFSIVRRVSDYAFTKPARETLYTVVAPEERYLSKNFLDAFVYRGGDALGGWAYKGLTATSLAFSTTGIAGIAIALAAAWGACAVWLGRAVEKRRTAADSAKQEGRAAAHGR